MIAKHLWRIPSFVLLKEYKAYWLALSIGCGAIVCMALLVSHSGRSLRDKPEYRDTRFCNGNCICDGGVADPTLMERVCPKGWEPAYKSAKRKIRRARRLRRKNMREQKQREQALVPSV